MFISTIALLFNVTNNTLLAKHNPISKGNKGKSITEFVEEKNVAKKFSGVVLAAENNQVVAAIAVGTNNAQTPKPLTTDTLFEIASCTKIFTAIAVLKLPEQGKLKLDDSIADYLPGVPEDCRGISIRHLLQHTFA